MGIKHLNRYLQQECSKGINKISLNDLRGKTIAIDTSIYLYRFMGENALLENFYLITFLQVLILERMLNQPGL